MTLLMTLLTACISSDLIASGDLANFHIDDAPDPCLADTALGTGLRFFVIFPTP